MESISLQQLARFAGVSKTTASLILNGKWERYKISRATRDRVLRVAAENGYKPNVMARNLSMGKSMTAGLIVPGLRNFEYAVLAGELEKELHTEGYHTVIGISEGNEEKAEKLILEMKERMVDGIVLFSSAAVETAKESGMPVVVAGENAAGVSSISVNAEEGVRKFIGFWYPRGKRTIAYIGLKNGNDDLKKGFRENYIERFSMKDDRMFLAKTVDDEKKIEKILASVGGKGFNAVLFETPELLFAAMKILKASNDTAFDEVSFGCYGYSPFFDVAAREIVYVTKPLEQMAKEAAAVLTAMMQKKQKEDVHKQIEPEFLF